MNACYSAFTNIDSMAPFIIFTYLIATVIGSVVLLLTTWNVYLISTGRTAIDFLEQQTEFEMSLFNGIVLIFFILGVCKWIRSRI
jgi:hypothetical protein